MLFKDTIELVSVITTNDEDGFPVTTEIKRQVFADKNQSGSRNSTRRLYKISILNLCLMFERLIIRKKKTSLTMRGKRYKIVRTYDKDGEMTELICSRLESW